MTGRARAGLSAIGSLLLAAASAQAQAPSGDYTQPVQELFITSAVYVQDAHAGQLTTIFDYRKSGGDKAWTSLNEFQYGITKRLEFDVAVPFVSAPGRTGFGDAGLGDVEVGLQYGVSRSLHPLALTVGVGMTLPTGDEAQGHGDGQRVVEPFVVGARALGPVQIHAFVSAAFPNHGAPRGWSTGAGAMIPAHRFTLTAELVREDDGDEASTVAAPGAYFHITPTFEAGLAVPLELTGPARERGLIGIVTFSF